MQGRLFYAGAGNILLILLASTGCDELPPLPLKPVEAPELAIGAAFDARGAGNITGTVRWAGPVPRVRPFQAPLGTGTESLDRTIQAWPNPHAPAVDTADRGVGSAVVFLRGVAARDARPWDHPRVRVEMRGGQFHIHQGESDSRVGFVRPREAIELVSRQEWFEILQARGAAFFSIAFVEPGQAPSRRLDRRGRVEFCSGAGHFWMRAHLFVVEHPYYTRTDAAGRFSLPQVPPGDYQLVCWHPNWHTGDYERDIGTMLLTHLAFQPAVEVNQPIHLERGGTVNATFTLSTEDFDP